MQNLFGPLQISPSPQSATEEHLVTQLPAVESNTDTILVNALVVHHLPLRQGVKLTVNFKLVIDTSNFYIFALLYVYYFNN